MVDALCDRPCARGERARRESIYIVTGMAIMGTVTGMAITTVTGMAMVGVGGMVAIGAMA